MVTRMTSCPSLPSSHTPKLHSPLMTTWMTLGHPRHSTPPPVRLHTPTHTHPPMVTRMTSCPSFPSSHTPKLHSPLMTAWMTLGTPRHFPPHIRLHTPIDGHSNDLLPITPLLLYSKTPNHPHPHPHHHLHPFDSPLMTARMTYANCWRITPMPDGKRGIDKSDPVLAAGDC